MSPGLLIQFYSEWSAYIDHSFWNAEKQQADNKREYIGQYDGKDLSEMTNKQCKLYVLMEINLIVLFIWILWHWYLGMKKERRSNEKLTSS